MRLVLTLAVIPLLAIAHPAHACLNDRETVLTEREFRSRYEPSQTPAATPSTDHPLPYSQRLWNPYGLSAAAAGILLLSASFYISRSRLVK